MKKQLVNKFHTIMVLIGMLVSMFPIQVFAETTDLMGISISKAEFVKEDGTTITDQNRVNAGATVTAKIHWKQSTEGVIEEGSVFSYQLPENLVFQNTNGQLANAQGSYIVENNQLKLVLNKNYELREGSKLPDSESVTLHEGVLELVANTKATNVKEEIVQFDQQVSSTLYFMTAPDDAPVSSNSEATESVKNSDQPSTKEKKAQKKSRALVSGFNVTGLKLEKASSTAPGGWKEIKNGDKTKVGDFIRLKIDWEILSSLSIAAGDYVEIDLPSIFKFAPTNKVALNITADEQSYNVGEYQLITVGDHSKVRIEFNDTIKQNNISSITQGHFTFQGSLNETKAEQEKVEIGSIVLPDFEIGESGLNEVGPGTYQDFSKEGAQRQNENALSWRIVTNYTDLMRAYKGEALQNRYENAVMIDELAEGLEFTSLSIQIPVLLADDSKLYARQVDSLSVTTIEVSPKGTYQASYDYIKTCPAGTYTVFVESTGKQKVIMNLGNFPVKTAGDKSNCLNLSQSKSDAIQKISNAYDSNTTLPTANKADTLKALDNLFDASQNTGIVGFLVNIVTKVDEDHLDQKAFDNKASVNFDGDRTIDAEANNVYFQDITGGATGTIPKGTVEVIKKDQASKANLSNVVFSVVKYDGNVEGTEVARLTTNGQGKVTFENLPIGKYKIKEISGLANYNPKMIIEDQNGITSDGVFEIKATDTSGFQFTILNKKMTVNKQLAAMKTLTGRDLKADEFEFELVDAQGNILDTQTNNGVGEILFDAITYDTEGTYTYTIREKAGSDSMITYDKKECTATVTVKNTGTKLEATVTYSGNATFENRYKPAVGSAVIKAHKTLTGRELQAGEFEFELVDDQAKVIDTKTNDASGNIYFDAINYDKAGTYTYTIREKTGADSTITYDKAEYQATVTVKDEGGKLKATVTYSGNATFENRYKPAAGSAVIKAHKILTGRELQAGEFEFELVDGQAKVIDTKINDASGNIHFDAINYDKAGTYTYTIREKTGADSTITYDKAEYQATVTVKDESGKLKATVTYSGNTTFENTYKPTTGSAVIEAHKTLTGRELQAGEFEFELVDDQAKVIDTKTNDASGNIYFDAINYDKSGTYTYTIREKTGADSTITYDKAEYQATVTVKDESGKLKATVTYSGNTIFENTYKPAAGSAVIEAHKTLTGRELQAGEFEFELVDDQAKVIDTKTNDASGNIYFDAINYDKSGTYTYTIREKTGADSTITYDKAEYQVIVTVKDERGKLKAISEYSEAVKFKNTYNAPDKGKVTLKKIDDKTGKTLAGAEFELQDEAGEKIKGFEQLVTNNKGEVTITNLEIGNYQVVETKAPVGYVIDKKPIKFAVTENETAKKELVKENKKQKQGIFLKKIDSSNKKALAKAEFTLQTETKKVIQEKLTTNENGLIYLSDLKPGKYQFVETKAPVGYKIDKTPLRFEVIGNEIHAIELVKENDLIVIADHSNNSPSNNQDGKKTTQNLPRTGSDVQSIFLYMGVGILLLGLLLGYKQYRARNVR